MRVEGPIPFHVARAYGVQPALRAARAPGAAGTGPAPQANAPTGIGVATGSPNLHAATAVRSAKAADAAFAAGVSRPRLIDRLIGASVHQPISFDGAATVSPDSASLQLYTRAADKIEAAVAVNVGRAIDVTG